MAKAVQVDVMGTEALLRTLKKMAPSLAENGLRQGVAAAGRKGREITRNNLVPHKRTGNLAKSVGVSTRVNRRTQSVDGTFGYRQRRKEKASWTQDRKDRERTKADGFYGRFLEDGTDRITSPPRPLIRAGIALGPQAAAVINQTLRKNFSKIVKKARAKGTIR
jgi:hypothetical protein